MWKAGQFETDARHGGARRIALRLGVIYILISAVWIIGSDWLVYDVLPIQESPQAQTVKGLFFVVATGALLIYLAHRWTKELTLGARRYQPLLFDAVRALTAALEKGDPYTAQHSVRVARYSVAIAREMGYSASQLRTLELAALVHDIGKVGIPAEILTKPGQLTDGEMMLVREHAQNGFDILAKVRFDEPIAEIAHQHHERLDGSGYPQGLKGEAIREEAQIIAVADVYESMAAPRPYRQAPGVAAALRELSEGKNSRYNASAVDALIRLSGTPDFKLEESAFSRTG